MVWQEERKKAKDKPKGDDDWLVADGKASDAKVILRFID